MKKLLIFIIVFVFFTISAKSPHNKSKHIQHEKPNSSANIIFQPPNGDVLDAMANERTSFLSKNNDFNHEISAKSAILIDSQSNTILFSKNEEEKLPIASMCKIMTLILTFEEISLGKLKMDELVLISKNASSMGGSQVFLRENEEYLVSDLIKSIVISSANDSCVALAEKISGTADKFVEKMNEKALGLGMNHTVFTNCTGLPKPGQFSCAKDVAIMMSKLVQNPEYFQFSSIWMDKIYHKDGTFTELANTNKLLRTMEGCDGGKTGYTGEAKYCLAVTANQENLRLISVVVGAESSKNRFEEGKRLIQYGFSNYKNVEVLNDAPLSSPLCPIKGGKDKFIAVKPAKKSFLLLPRGEKADVYTETTFYKNIKAPILIGQEVGIVDVYYKGVKKDTIKLVSAVNTPKKSLKDAIYEILCAFFN